MKKSFRNCMKEIIRKLLIEIGENPQRPGLVDTPDRVARMWQELTEGYHTNIKELVGDALFDVGCSEMVIVKNIEYYSLCEHHLLPFYGKCHVAYIPHGKVIGLSKIPRIVDAFAKRLQVQEHMTQQIAACLEEVTGATGVAVVAEGVHMCMCMRGVEKQHSNMITRAMRGQFAKDASLRSEFLSQI